MGSIRIGFFEDFKGAYTLLIDVDAEGLRGLIAWLRDVISSGRSVLLSDCPSVSLQSGLQVEAFPVRDDTGLLKSGEGALFGSAQRKAGRTSLKNWAQWGPVLAISTSTALGMTCK